MKRFLKRPALWLLLGMLASHIQGPVQIVAAQFPVMAPRKAAVIAHVISVPAQMWETQMECLAPGFDLGLLG